MNILQSQILSRVAYKRHISLEDKKKTKNNNYSTNTMFLALQRCNSGPLQVLSSLFGSAAGMRTEHVSSLHNQINKKKNGPFVGNGAEVSPHLGPNQSLVGSVTSVSRGR